MNREQALVAARYMMLCTDDLWVLGEPQNGRWPVVMSVDGREMCILWTRVGCLAYLTRWQTRQPPTGATIGSMPSTPSLEGR